jgi:hypothetical protein
MGLVINARDVAEQIARPNMAGDSKPPTFQMVHASG